MTDPREPIRVLVVDDEPAVRAAFASVLKPRSAAHADLDAMEAALFGASGSRVPDGPDDVVLVPQGEDACLVVERALAAGVRYAVAFVDMRMPPGWDGLQTAERLRAIDPQIQIVICTAYSDHSWDDVVARLGHVDGLLLLKKPFDPSEVRQMAAALGEKWRLTRQADADLARMHQLTTRLEATVSHLKLEVQSRVAAEQSLHQHAYFDALTGLPNRLRLHDRLADAFARKRRDPRYSFAVLFFDLDGFKLVNDSLGHDMGDRVLVEIARRLNDGLRDVDSVGRVAEEPASRLGGDEFVVVLDGVASDADAAVVADRLLTQISKPIDLVVQQVALSASVGIAVAGSHHASGDEILRDADTAMYRAKFERLRIATFDPAMQETARKRLCLESDMRRAVEAEHFSLAFQPIMHAASGKIAAIEALVRWDHPDYPTRMPDEFIPTAEETGLIVPLGRWILEAACRALADIRAKSPDASDLRLSVNVSRRQLLDPRFPADVREILRRTGVPANRLDIEVTESALIGDEAAAIHRLGELKQVGVGLHLDDFGTGYSSLSCLQSFPLDVVKIDRSFIRTLSESTKSASVVEAIVNLAHRLGIRVTIEGVETDPQLAAIQELGSDYAQGFLFHRPLPVARIHELLATARALQSGRALASVAQTAHVTSQITEIA
ncbi:MAG: EAL domain-containing protein [Planctomycetes bacterium]|nr:EAL domain-containing protein [Planctomycetota bacterium]